MTKVVPCVDEHAEAAYLTAIMTRPETLLEHAVSPEDIATRGRRIVLTAMDAIVRRRHELTTQSLVSEIERIGVSPETAFDMAAEATSGPIVSPPTVAKRLRDLAEMRRRREQALRIVEACDAHALDDARGLCSALGGSFTSAGDVEVLTFRDVTERTIAAFVDRGTNRDRSVALGMPSIDRSWRPYPGSLTVVGAQTGVGKSTVMYDWTLKLARSGVSVGFVSTEDPEEDFGGKWLGELGQVDPAALWRKRVDADDMRRILAAADAHSRLPISFSVVTTRKLDDVLAAMRLQSRRHGARVIFVDYLQNIIGRPNSGREVRERIDAVLADLIVEAAGLGVALVLASQLRRPDGNLAAEPTVQSLKESGTIENRAQAIVLLWKDEKRTNVVHAKLAKVKRAPSGKRFTLARNPNTGALVEEDDGRSDDEYGS